jgi:hypothetical protein
VSKFTKFTKFMLDPGESDKITRAATMTPFETSAGAKDRI